MKRLFFAAAVVFGSASFAMAADPVVYEPVPAPPTHPFHHAATHDWSGLYLGGYVGALVGGSFTGDGAGGGLSGFDAGASLQYNAVLDGNIVLSPFVAVTLPVQSGEWDPEGFEIPVNVLWAAQAGVRLGYAHGRFLPYVYAGGVIGAARAGNPTPPTTNTHTGYTLGAGVDYALDDRWTLGARYAFYSLGAEVYDTGQSVGWRGHSILATISFKLH